MSIKKSYTFDGGCDRWTSPTMMIEIPIRVQEIDGEVYRQVEKHTFYNKDGFKKKYQELLEKGYTREQMIFKRKIANKWLEVEEMK